MLFTKTALVMAMAMALIAKADVTFDLFSDGNCQNKIGERTVYAGTCASTNPGFSSMKPTWASIGSGSTATAYTQNNCGCPTCGSHGYNPHVDECLKDFGFVANAIGLS
ncbi:hypothetical protein FSARC_4150 [Fusarium sarcochroum]|uniref:Uncharacterized protein n=1 Tax=Fusarium sarcochroum TaxID=1208366 RepID=A0A8H4U273_9HYPO|nr:hypothetical protein FSARC_4150 [Fusarium sarcochroum]